MDIPKIKNISGGPKDSGGSTSLNINSSKPAQPPKNYNVTSPNGGKLTGMGTGMGSSALPRPSIANAASGIAHPGGTADLAGINVAAQQQQGLGNLGAANSGFQQFPMVPGGMPMKSGASALVVGQLAGYKEAAPLGSMMRGLWKGLRPAGKAIANRAGSVADEVIQQMPSTAHNLGRAVGKGKQILGETFGQTAKKVAPAGEVVGEAAAKAAPGAMPHGDPIPRNVPAPPAPHPVNPPRPAVPNDPSAAKGPGFIPEEFRPKPTQGSDQYGRVYNINSDGSKSFAYDYPDLRNPNGISPMPKPRVEQNTDLPPFLRSDEEQAALASEIAGIKQQRAQQKAQVASAATPQAATPAPVAQTPKVQNTLPQSTIRPGTGAGNPNLTSVADTGVATGPGSVRTVVGAGAAEDAPGLASRSYGTKVQGKPVNTQTVGRGFGNPAPVESAIPGAATQAAPSVGRTLGQRAGDAARGVGSKLHDAAGQIKDYAGYGLGAGLGTAAADAIFPGAGTFGEVVGGTIGGLLGGKGFGSVKGLKGVPVTLGGMAASGALTDYLYGANSGHPVSKETQSAAAGETAPPAGEGMPSYANPGETAPPAGADAPAAPPAAPAPAAQPAPTPAAPASAPAASPVAGQPAPGAAPGNKNEMGGFFSRAKTALSWVATGEVDPNDPNVKAMESKLLNSPEGQAKIIGGMREKWSQMNTDQKVAMVKELGLGALGEYFIRFSELPGPMQAILSIGLFAGLGGLLGGRGGAVGGAAVGLAPLIIANLPAITKMWNEMGKPGAEPPAAQPDPNKITMDPGANPGQPAPAPAPAAPPQQPVVRPRPEITPSSGVGGF